MLPLLRDPRVVHDPRPYRGVPLELREGIVPCHPENRTILPGRLRHKVVQELVRATHMPRIDLRGHGLHALPLPEQEQTRQICLQRPTPIGVADRLRQSLDETIEPCPVDAAMGAAPSCHPPATVEKSFMTQWY